MYKDSFWWTRYYNKIYKRRYQLTVIFNISFLAIQFIILSL